MQTMTAADTPPAQRSAPHRARAFAELPDAAHALDLLAELADAPCDFAPVSMDRPLALYGAGDLGRLAREFLTGVGHDFTLVVDRNADALAGTPYWSDVALRHPDAVLPAAKRDFRLAVSIVKAPYLPIERALRRKRLRRCRAVLRPSGEFPRRASAVERLVRAGLDRKRPRQHCQGADNLARRKIACPSPAVSGLAAAARGMELRCRPGDDARTASSFRKCSAC